MALVLVRHPGCLLSLTMPTTFLPHDTSLSLLQYASFTPETGEHYMTPSDFVRGYLGLLSEPDTCDDTVKRLAGCVDTTKDG